MGTIEKWTRQISFFFDKGVYWLVEQAYNLVVKLSEVSLLKSDVIDDFAKRIYILLGIVMLFKVAISLINYFLNPESFNDSQAGMGSVLKRILISLILIVVVPICFDMAFELQGVILKNHILESAILGASSDQTTIQETANNGGKIISVTLFKSFFRPESDDNVNEFSVSSVSDFEDDLLDPTYEYKIPLSTIAGGFAAYVLIMFCFDVAVRSVKLSFLQLISPVPIISYVDPKKGDQLFKKWLSECASTFVSVFIRLASLYFVMYLISELSFNGWKVYNVVTDEQQDIGWVATAFIILGLLLFMNEAPKLICDILGIKDSGGFTLDPRKKISSSPYAAAVVGGGLAAAGTMVGNTWNTAKKIKSRTSTGSDGKLHYAGGTSGLLTDIGLGFGSIVTGGISGGSRASFDGLTSGGKKSVQAIARKGIDTASKNRNLRAQGFTMFGNARDKAADLFGIQGSMGTTGELNNQIRQKQRELDNISGDEEFIRQQMSLISTQDNGQKAVDYNKSNAGSYVDGNWVYKYSSYEKYTEENSATSLSKEDFEKYRELNNQRLETDDKQKQLQKDIKELTEAKENHGNAMKRPDK